MSHTIARADNVVERPTDVYRELYTDPEDAATRVMRHVTDDLRMVASVLLAFVMVVTSAFVLRTFASVIYPDVVQAGDIYEIQNENTQGLPVATRFINSVLGVETAHAASRYDSMYSAELVGEIPDVQMMPYSEKNITLKFLNIGTESWVTAGRNYSSLYTDPSTRDSVFSCYGWCGRGQPAMMVEDRVGPGEIGTFVLPVQAPGELGKYEEKFKVAIEDVAWIRGSYVTIPITVTKTPKVADAGEGLAGNVLIRSHKKIKAPGGEKISVRFGIKNVGPRTWKEVRVIEPGVVLAVEGSSEFHDSAWPEGRVALALGPQEYKTGQLALLTVPVRTPRDVGEYTLKLQLTAEGENVAGGLFELPVTVTTPAPEEINNDPLPVVIEPWRGIEEPRFRVGVGSVPDAAIVEVNSPYRIVDGRDKYYGTIIPGHGAEWFFDAATNTQLFSVNGVLFKADTYFRLEPTNPDVGVVTISSIDDRARWNPSINYNAFRDVIEMRRNTYNYTWMVNELPMESYVKGLTEVSNVWPLEMHKAQVIAARSFAMYYHERGGKHQSSKSAYSLNSSSYDQVYKGFAAEQINSNVVKAAELTRGIVVRYEGKTAMTTYFARSNGTTRSFKEVWGGGGRSYLVPRDAPYDRAKGNVRWGHGVGMSQTDGAMRADAGFRYPEILQSYYTGVTIDRVYE